MGQDSKKLLFDLKMNGTCNSIVFSQDERYMWSVGDEAEIYQWDLQSRKCIKKTADEGGFNTVKIAISPNGLLLATASKMGTVNLFNVSPYTQLVDDKPFKTLGHLTTSITDLQFNPTSQMLAYCSKWKKNAIKITHIPSYTAFQNFPDNNAPGVLKYAFCIAYSHDGRFMAMGNDQGKAHLFQFSHFSP